MKRDVRPIEVLSTSLITMPRTALGRWGTCLLVRVNTADLPIGDPMVLHAIAATNVPEPNHDVSRGEGTVALTLVSPLAGPQVGWLLELPRTVLGLIVSDEETSIASTAGRSWVPLILAGEGPVEPNTTWTVSVTEPVVAPAMPGWMGSSGRSVRNAGWGIAEDEPPASPVSVVSARKNTTTNSPDRGRTWQTSAQRVATNLWWTAIASVLTGEPSGWGRVQEISIAVGRGASGHPDQLLDAYVGWLLTIGNSALTASYKDAPKVSLRAPQHGRHSHSKKPSGWALLTDLPSAMNVPYLAIEDAADGVRLEEVVERHGADDALVAAAIVLTARARAANLTGTDDAAVSQRLAKWLTPSSIPIGWEAEGCLAPLLNYEIAVARNAMLTADLGRLRIWLHVTLERLHSYNQQVADAYGAARAVHGHEAFRNTPLPLEDVLLGAGGLLAEQRAATNPTSCPICSVIDLILDGIPASDVAACAAATVPLLADIEAQNERLPLGDAAWTGFRRSYIGNCLIEVRQGWDGLRTGGHVCPSQGAKHSAERGKRDK